MKKAEIKGEEGRNKSRREGVLGSKNDTIKMFGNRFYIAKTHTIATEDNKDDKY
ncbi:hypothetical protein [Hoylesella nanceiensis]